MRNADSSSEAISVTVIRMVQVQYNIISWSYGPHQFITVPKYVYHILRSPSQMNSLHWLTHYSSKIHTPHPTQPQYTSVFQVAFAIHFLPIKINYFTP
jgi:hypothetical protein